MALEELKLLTKLEELDQYTHQVLLQYPKYEKFVLAAQIRQTLAELIHHAIRCGKKFHKKTSLQDMDIEVEYLRSLIRKSHVLGYINIHRYEVWISHVNEIGKMVGGWMKAAK
jgi:hypothetical protein